MDQTCQHISYGDTHCVTIIIITVIVIISIVPLSSCYVLFPFYFILYHLIVF